MRGSPTATACSVGLVVAIVLTLSVACAYQRAYVAYDSPGTRLPLATTPLAGEAIGVVRAAEGGPVWKDCTKVAEAAVWVLIEDTRRLGGNAIGNVRWFPNTSAATDRPCCRQRWGWVLVWPVLATPAFQIAEVEGTAFRLAEPVREIGSVYLIPEGAEARAELVARIVDDALRDAR